MLTNVYNLGDTYKTVRVDTAHEFTPQHSDFRSWENEVFFCEPVILCSYDEIQQRLMNGEFDEFDLKVIRLLATFASTAITANILWGLLYMTGEDLVSDKERLHRTLYKLYRNGITIGGRFKRADRSMISRMRVIRLTYAGFKLARNLGVNERYNPVEELDAPTVKLRLEVATLILQFLKHRAEDIESFAIRPYYKRRAKHPDAYLRPGAQVRMFGEDIFFEAARREIPDHLALFANKLRRYTLVFEEPPCIVVNGEDEEHNRAILAYLTEHQDEHGFPLCNLRFTHDLALFGARFNTCLYAFDAGGNKISFAFEEEAPAAEEVLAAS